LYIKSVILHTVQQIKSLIHCTKNSLDFNWNDRVFNKIFSWKGGDQGDVLNDRVFNKIFSWKGGDQGDVLNDRVFNKIFSWKGGDQGDVLMIQCLPNMQVGLTTRQVWCLIKL
jgi:hypothetical protein